MSGLRIALLVAWPLLAHAAAATGNGWLAALAVLDIVLLLLLDALARPRAWAGASLRPSTPRRGNRWRRKCGAIPAT